MSASLENAFGLSIVKSLKELSGSSESEDLTTAIDLLKKHFKTLHLFAYLGLQMLY